MKLLISLLLIGMLPITASLAQGNATARYEIDAKRIGVDPLDKDAIPRSREFIRLDSTYYVGYMIEGTYKADKSSDYLGYKNAIPPLRKAFVLFQHDFARELKTLYQSPQQYMQSMNRYLDFLQLSNTLRECYDNIEMPDSVMWVLNQVSSYNFVKDHLGVNTIKAWTYHRNRFYTSDKFAFLENSVAANEQKAFSYCYHALYEIVKNRPVNDVWFGPNQAAADRLSVYHYLALLHCYNKNYDSSQYYYQQLAEAGAVSWNNYGLMKYEVGELPTAQEFLERNKYTYTSKVLKEPFYYLPMLDVLAGRTKKAMDMCKEAIVNSNSTPGFGWYNIALARSYLYDGQLDSADYAIQKAADFKEIHIGTTLTQSQYDFTINMLKLQITEKRMDLVKFSNKGWWYSPGALYNLLALKVNKILLQYVLINQLSANPERNRTVYDLFCGEATTTFDETYYLIKDFTPQYFVNKYQLYQKKDDRQNLQKYFQLVTNEMKWADGDEDEATAGFDQMAKNVLLDTANEKLFLARLYIGLAKGAHENRNRTSEAFYMNNLFETYPQLVPFTGLQPNIKLTVSGVNNGTIQKIVGQIKSCDINWVSEQDANTMLANINFEQRGDRYAATVNVKSAANKLIVNNSKLVFSNTSQVGNELALRLFNKGGAIELNR